MRVEQWRAFKAAAKAQTSGAPPLALIVDSPWIPGYLGISHLDYFLNPETWFQSNLRLQREFPDVILFPSWWVEYGMAVEPSAFGTRLHFLPGQTPAQSPVLFRCEDIDRFTPVNPLTDGLMPFALHHYRTQRQRVFDSGFTIPVVSARGPLCTAAFVRGVNELMVDLVEAPDAVHRLLRYSTGATIAWLRAQAEAIGDCVEGLFLLDDIAGFLSRRMYREFAHPYFKQVCDAFPRDWVKVYHNDAKVRPFLADLPDTGFDVLNFTHNLDIAEVDQAVGGRLTLMGNVNPLELGVRGTPGEVQAAARQVLRKMRGRRLILSLGGGVSPGMPAANIRALARALQEA